MARQHEGSTAQRETPFFSFLTECSPLEWRVVLERLLPQIHPVDQDATRIWFAFWPLQLHQIISRSQDLNKTVLDHELKGRYRLAEQLDSSVAFLYGARYWPEVKRAVLACAGAFSKAEEMTLDASILSVVKELASQRRVPESILVGITAVAFMALQQSGRSAFVATIDNPAPVSGSRASPEAVLKARMKSKGDLLNFFRTVDRRYSIVFNENRSGCRFKVIHGQDITMAGETDRRDYHSADPRCTAGPVPFDCRIGSCGTCWVGVLRGKERLSEITPYERARLKYFGYDFTNSDQESHPPIRLSCQSRCYGDVTIVVPAWNGVLNMRRAEWE